jgi:hypothetical protein
MTPQEFRAKWGAEADAMRRRGAVVNGAAVLDEVLADFASLTQGEAEALLNLQHASQESGYSADHLGRLIRDGTIPNAGRPNAPKIRRGDLPRKAAGLRWAQVPRSLLGATPGQIARAVVTSHREEGR